MSDELKEKIMQRIQIDSETGCWNWIGATGQNKLPIIYNKKKNISVRKYIYGVYFGDVLIPSIQVKNKCENIGCVSPDHLVLQKAGLQGALANKNKTHCKRGHEYMSDRVRARGDRYCPECNKIHKKNYRDRKKNEHTT